MEPCLCGDPYCGSCGNPEAAALADAEQEMLDFCAEMYLTVEEYKCFMEAGKAAVETQRKITIKMYSNEDGVWEEFN